MSWTVWIFFFTNLPNTFLPYKIYERVEKGHNQKKEDFLKIVTKRDFHSERTNVRYIKRFMIHPDFKPSTKFPDLAILMLVRKFDFERDPFQNPKGQNQGYRNRYNLINCGHKKLFLCVLKKGLWSRFCARQHLKLMERFSELILTIFQFCQNQIIPKKYSSLCTGSINNTIPFL